MEWKQLFKSKAEKNQQVAVQFAASGIAISFGEQSAIQSQFIPVPTQDQLAVLKAYVTEHKLRHLPCTAILDAHYKLLLVNKPNVPDAEIAQALPWVVKELIDFPIEDAVVDSFPIPSHDDTQKLYTVISKKAELIELKNTLVDAGLTLERITILELALLDITQQETNDNESCGLIYCKEGNIHMLVAKDGLLHFTRKIGKLNSDDSSAILLELQRSIDYCQVQLKLPSLSHLFLASEEEKLQFLIENQDLSTTPKALNLNNSTINCAATTGELMRHETAN